VEGEERVMGRKRDKKLVDPAGPYSDPAAVLRAFMAEMSEWERRARVAVDGSKGRDLPSNALNPFWQELGVIFDRYCTPGSGERRGRLQYRPIRSPVENRCLQ
jgi:hypothetical protein